MVHLLVTLETHREALDWLLAPTLEALRSELAHCVGAVMQERHDVLLELPNVGPVQSRLRLEALLAVVEDLAEAERAVPFSVVLAPHNDDVIAAVDTLQSMTIARGLVWAGDAGRPRLSMPTAQDQFDYSDSTGRAVGALAGTFATSSSLSTIGAAGLGGGAALLGVQLGAVAVPGLLVLAGPVGLIGAAGMAAAGWWGRKKRQEALEEELHCREAAWVRRVEVLAQEQESRHRSDVELLVDRIRGLEATVAQQSLILSELRSRTGTTPSGPELAQPIAFAVSLAGDLAEPIQRRENLKYAWRLLVRYIGALMLSDLDQRGRCTPEAAVAIQKALMEKCGDGRWLHLCRTIADLTAGEGSFFGAQPTAWTRGGKKGYGTLLAPLDRLRDARNDAEHGSRIPSPGVAESWLADAQPHWSRALEEARPYTGCRLFIVESIVDFSDGRETVYQVRWLVGDLLYPRAERCCWPIRLSPGRLCVLRAGLDRPASAEDVLDVSTFLRWEHSRVLDRPETYGVVGLGEDTLQFGAFRFQDERALGGTVPEWLAAK
jgi:hypothetical protein